LQFFNRQPQIFDTGDRGAQHFKFVPKFLQSEDFSASSFAFLDESLSATRRSFGGPKFRACRLPPLSQPWHHWLWGRRLGMEVATSWTV